MNSASSRDHPHASAWEWAQLAVLGVNMTWTTLCLGGFRPETMIVTSALNGVLVVLHLAARIPAQAHGAPAERRGLWGYHAAGWLLLPFLIYGAMNVVWVSPVRWLGWRDWLGWAQMIAVFWVVLNGLRSRSCRVALLWLLAILGFVAVLLACYQRFVKPDWLMLGRTQVRYFFGRSSGPFGIPNSLAAMLVLLLPPMLALAWRQGASAAQRLLCGYLALVFAFGLVLTISRGAILSLGLALVLWPLVGTQASRGRRLVATVGVAAGLVSLGAILFFTVPLVHERALQLRTNSGELTRPIMWRAAWRIFRERPAWGGGAGSYNVRFEKFRPEQFQDEPVWAHNDYLNTLCDYGLTGFALFFGGCGAIGWRARRSRSEVEGGANSDEALIVNAMIVGVAAFALQLLVDFNFKIPALAMLFATVAGLVVQFRWRGGPTAATRSALGRIVTAAGAVAIAVETIWGIVPFYRGEALRYRAHQQVDRLAIDALAVSAWPRVLTPARESLRAAVSYAPENGAAWSDLSYVTALGAHLDPAHVIEIGREAESAAREALGRSTIVPEFWTRLGVALDLQRRGNEAGQAFIAALKLAPARGSVWYYEAFHLSLDPTDPNRALAAAEFCLRLDPGNREAQALRERLAGRSRAP